MVYFFEPDDVDSMSDAILAASADEEGRLNRAREARRFLEIHGWESHKSGFMEMYKNI
jgi:glycosyltransferase involved in cell wall biosynthesis